MIVKEFFLDWKFDAFIGMINIFGFIGVKMDLVSRFINNTSTQSLIEFILLFIAICLFIKATIIGRKMPNIAEIVLRDIADATKNKELALYSFREYGYSAAQIHETWEIFLRKFPSSIGRADLDYHSIGNEFYFVDFSSGKEISIPTGNRARTEKVGNSIYPGMVLRLMQRHT